MANVVGGTIIWELDADTKKFTAKLDEASQEARNFGNKTEQTTSLANRGFQNLAKIGMAAVTAASVAVGAAIVKNIGNAVKRVDILNNFPKVMTNLGYGADEAQRALKALDAGVKGLPTSLDGIVNSMQAILPASKSVDYATKLTLAMNNALLAGGKPAADQANAMEQFSKALAKGKPSLLDWQTLVRTMPGQMDQLTQKLGFGRGEWVKMHEALQDGKLKFSDVTDAIIELNEKGLNGLPGYAEQAKNATKGIGTAMANANTAITRGIAKVIQAIGAESIGNAITNIGKAFEKGFKVIVAVIEKVKGFLEKNQWAVEALKGAFVGVAVAIGIALLPMLESLIVTIGSVLLVLTPFIIAGGLLALVAMVIKRNWDKIKPVIDKVKDAFSAFWEKIKPLRDFIARQFKTAWEELSKSLSKMKDVFKNVWKALQPIMPQLKILGIIIGVALLTPIILLIAGLVLLVGIFIAVITIVARLIGWISKIPFIIADIVKAIWNFFGNAGDWLKQKGKDIIQGLIDGIVSMGTNVIIVATWLKEKGKEIVQGLIDGVKSMAEAVWNAIKFVADKIGAFFVGAASWLWNAGRAVVSGLANGINSVAGWVWGAISNVSAQIGRFFAGAGRWLWDTGRAIIRGLADGIWSAVGWVKDALGYITRNMRNWKGPMSKDRVLLQENAEVIIGGFVSGLESQYSKIQDSLGGLTGQIPGMVQATPASANTSNTTITFTGPINLQDKSAVDEFFTKLNRNNELAQKGMSIL